MQSVFATLGRGVAVALLLGAASAQAQTAPAAAPPPAAQAPTVPDVGQPEPPAAAVAAGRALVVASGMSRSFTPMVPQLSGQIVPLLTRTRPELKDNLQIVLKQLEPDFTKKGDEMTEIAAKIYARHMSQDELEQAAAFFKSPVGMKYVEVQPAMLDEVVVAMQTWTQSLSSYMMQRVHDEMKAKGQDF
ncbi:DUF2059 domain-containing protein [Lichenihabitans sp. Uapishka_5]|uniref:DUF2059 domain-containing protein n=1 Tax=Lichenihabitans sp. Uapishka_5 TaxID=3037302 RepID=UPI0029E7F168|nr:DUF2059 domain-containing protein [Lichenihabitans sp. Uapishka_5]MDX7950737.1 DUF2059 domain-containing protein [Lichenihabitans sp. Uapishka_5]